MRNDAERPSVIVIGGPTASGKSGAAVMLAERLDGVVINADSMQLYEALPILSASPTRELKQRAPHRLYGVLPADRTATAAAWRDWARREIAEAYAASKQPIVVGGTGLYLEALMQGLSAIPPVPDEVRKKSREDLGIMGNAAFHARLVAIDPASARLASGDSHRIVRAWEVLQATGMPLADWQSRRAQTEGWQFRCFAIVPPRTVLYQACDERFRHMIGQGALDELATLQQAGGAEWPVMRTLGARPLLDHLMGHTDLKTALILGQAATRHYAKRQTTWFRNRFMRDETARILENSEQLLTAI